MCGRLAERTGPAGERDADAESDRGGGGGETGETKGLGGNEACPREYRFVCGGIDGIVVADEDEQYHHSAPGYAAADCRTWKELRRRERGLDSMFRLHHVCSAFVSLVFVELLGNEIRFVVCFSQERAVNC